MQARPIHEIENEKRRIAIASSSVHAIDSINLGAIFLMTGSLFLHAILESTAKFAMFPFAAALLILNTVLTWRMAALNKYEGSSVARAVVETIGAIAVTAAVTGSLVGAVVLSGIFAIAGPAIFAATMTMKTLANIGFAIYHGVMAARENDPVKKAEHKLKVIESIAGAVIAAMAGAAITVVMIFAKPALFFIGVIGSGLGTIMGIAKAIMLARQKPAAADAGYQPVADANLSTTAQLQSVLNDRDNNLKPQPSPSIPILGYNSSEDESENAFSLHDSTPEEDKRDIPHPKTPSFEF